MAGKRYGQFIGPSEPMQDRKSSAQRSVNLYVAGIDAAGEDKIRTLESAPGYLSLQQMPADVRGMVVARNIWFVVAGDKLYTVTVAADNSVTYTAVGTLVTPVGHVSMKETRDQLVIVDGPNGYVYNFVAGSFAQITDSDWRGSDNVEELGGYSIFVPPGTDQFYLSDVDSAATLDALDFSSADAQPDNVITHRVVRQELLLLGDRSIETWVLAGDTDFPLTRYNSTPIDVGVVGKRAAINAADTLFFVGTTGRGAAYVYELQGHQPLRISTQAVEEAISAATDLSGMWMWTYQAEGSEFIGLTAPGMTSTWVFDASTRLWHERCELVLGVYAQSPMNYIVSQDGRFWCSSGAYLLEVRKDKYVGISGPLVRERVWPHLIRPNLEPVSYLGVELACTTGADMAEGRVSLEISNDGGYVFGSPLLRSLGAVGRRMQRVRWLYLGTSRDRVFRLRVSDPVPLTLHAATVNTQ
jgi:hypothetical protein